MCVCTSVFVFSLHMLSSSTVSEYHYHYVRGCPSWCLRSLVWMCLCSHLGATTIFCDNIVLEVSGRADACNVLTSVFRSG
jgi:hypothetical protein